MLVRFFSFYEEPWYLDNFETFCVVSPCSLSPIFLQKNNLFCKGRHFVCCFLQLKSFFWVPDRLTTLWGIFHFGRVDKIPLIYAKTFRCLLPQKTNRTNNPPNIYVIFQELFFYDIASLMEKNSNFLSIIEQDQF